MLRCLIFTKPNMTTLMFKYPLLHIIRHFAVFPFRATFWELLIMCSNLVHSRKTVWKIPLLCPVLFYPALTEKFPNIWEFHIQISVSGKLKWGGYTTLHLTCSRGKVLLQKKESRHLTTGVSTSSLQESICNSEQRKKTQDIIKSGLSLFF